MRIFYASLVLINHNLRRDFVYSTGMVCFIEYWWTMWVGGLGCGDWVEG